MVTLEGKHYHWTLEKDKYYTCVNLKGIRGTDNAVLLACYKYISTHIYGESAQVKVDQFNDEDFII